MINLHLTNIMKLFDHENLELYGSCYQRQSRSGRLCNNNDCDDNEIMNVGLTLGHIKIITCLSSEVFKKNWGGRENFL